jgi:glycyl-tRNA synthetase beta chain
MQTMNHKNCLLEIGCEELPAWAQPQLVQQLTELTQTELQNAQLQFKSVSVWVTPRRFAIFVNDLLTIQPPRQVEKRGPALSAAYDNSGKPTPAALGFARSCGCEMTDLEKMETDKGAWLFYRAQLPGQNASAVLPQVFQTVLSKLSLGKTMRWGNSEVAFLRPVHWAVLLLGDEIIPATLLQQQTDRITFGHRFHHPEAIQLKTADDYQSAMQQAHVIVDFQARKLAIAEQIAQAAASVGGHCETDDALLSEVTSIVEWPVAFVGQFTETFLTVPSVALISAMKQHQKCFPVINQQGEMLPHFIFISNIQSRDPKVVIAGNERVMHARLSDAAFFYHEDCKHTLASRLTVLEKITFQRGLGSLLDKTKRIQQLALWIAKQIHANEALVERAALLCKTDLTTGMVGEFPELQGHMGYYYALHEGETNDIATALRECYQPRFAGDRLPATNIAACVAVADAIDTLVGIFGINKIPSGDKDPFALRRAALAIIRICLEMQLPIELDPLLALAKQQFQQALPNAEVIAQVKQFIIERLRVYYQTQEHHTNSIKAVFAKNINDLLDVNSRLHAVEHFRKLDAADSLSQANKRVNNLLKQTANDTTFLVDEKLLESAAEKELVHALTKKDQEIKPLLTAKKYQQILLALAELKQPVDQFFDQVMVMVEDERLKNNRLAILKQLHVLLSLVADIALLQG